MPKILFIAAHRLDRSPSQRFRFEQYLDFLKSKGFDWEFSYLIEAQDDKRFYSPGNYWFKLRTFIKSYRKRKRDARRASEFDIVFVQREAFMTGSTRFEKAFARSGAKLVFDFDDSIWLQNVSDANKKLKWLKDAQKTANIIEVSDLVVAGNEYLADYARQYNEKVCIIPTTIDTQEYQRIQQLPTDTITIGWSGSITTIQHFKYALPFLKKIHECYGGKVQFKVIGDGNYIHEELGIKGIAWNKQDEVSELSSFDIGVMPLPNDEWARGKCGLKGLQYMALAIPTIMSPVGVNADIIQDGVNGFLADGIEEWEAKLVQLIEDAELRKKMGDAARKTVVDKYSVLANQDLYLKWFQDLLG